MTEQNYFAADGGRVLPQAERELATSNSQAAPLAGLSTLHPMLQAEVWLHNRYRFRRNRLDGRLEAAPAGSGTFTPVGKETKRSMLMELLSAGIDLSSTIALDIIIDNAGVPLYDPILAWLDALPAWDGRDRIGTFFRSLTNDEWELEVLHRAFLATVAQMAGRSTPYGNELCPILVSTVQGWGKSKSIRRLLPPELDAFFTDTFHLKNEDDCLRRMASFALINLDELDHYGPGSMALLKNLIQMSDVKLRRAYASWMETRPRIASFWATTNRLYVLTDPTGSRRFFPVRLKRSLNLNARLNYPQFYAQALAELDEGTLKPWFTKEENRRIEEHNRPFCALLRLKDLLDTHFERVPFEGTGCSEQLAAHLGFLTAQEVWDDLMKLDPELMSCLSAHRFGNKLKELGAQALRGECHRRYNLRRRPTVPIPAPAAPIPVPATPIPVPVAPIPAPVAPIVPAQ